MQNSGLAFRAGVLAASLFLATAPALAANFAEDFNEDPFGQWKTGWLGANSNLENWYVVQGMGGEDYRGNNPDGLWISDGANDGPANIVFSASLAASLTSFDMDVAGYVPTTLTFFDKDGAILLSTAITLTHGAYSKPGGYAHYGVTSANGIGGFSFSNNAEGNTSIDNINTVASEAVPEPASWAMMLGGFGLIGAVLRSSRKAMLSFG